MTGGADGAPARPPGPSGLLRLTRMRSRISATAAPLVSNGFSAIANTAAVFALSSSAGVGFPRFAASTAALILAYGTARSLLGEPLMLTQRDRRTGLQAAFPSVAGWVALSLAGGVALGALAAAGLGLAGVDGVGWVTFAAIAALVFNDSCRHLCFARASAWSAAAADLCLAVITIAVWVLASSLSPYQVYGTWILAAALAGLAMLLAAQTRLSATDAPDPIVAATQWARSAWSRTRWLAAEAIAVTAAVTLPLILVSDAVAGPGRLLLSWFGFQQILFFAAYAMATRSGMDASRTALMLFLTGLVGSIVVGVGVALAPTDLLVMLFGPSAAAAQSWALWFAAAQIVTSAGNAAALGARLISGQSTALATDLFRGRILFAIVSTVAGTAGAVWSGIGGYIAGFASGGVLYVALAVAVLRRDQRVGSDNRTGREIRASDGSRKCAG